LKIRRTIDTVSIELSLPEASVLHDELSHVRGGARLPKLRQVVHELEVALKIEAERKLALVGKKSRLSVVR
jgi:hypothetical protein